MHTVRLSPERALEAFLGDLDTTPRSGTSSVPPVTGAICIAAYDPDLPGSLPPPQQPPLSIRAAGASCRVPPSLCCARVQESPTCSPSPTPPRRRPRLRIRLTLGRLPLPRNPQASGVAGSANRHSRYSFRHSHLWALHPALPVRLHRCPQRSPTMTPPRSGTIRGFGRLLEPRYIVGAGALDQ